MKTVCENSMRQEGKVMVEASQFSRYVSSYPRDLEAEIDVLEARTDRAKVILRFSPSGPEVTAASPSGRKFPDSQGRRSLLSRDLTFSQTTLLEERY